MTRLLWGGILMVGALLISSCAHVEPGANGSLGGYVAYMKKAAEVDRQSREHMKHEAGQLDSRSPLKSRLRWGLLLTSPGTSQSETRAGIALLKDILENENQLPPRVADLISTRLLEVRARETLREEVRNAENKIDELMSIESTMDKGKEDSRARRH